MGNNEGNALGRFARKEISLPLALQGRRLPIAFARATTCSALTGRSESIGTCDGFPSPGRCPGLICLAPLGPDRTNLKNIKSASEGRGYPRWRVLMLLCLRFSPRRGRTKQPRASPWGRENPRKRRKKALKGRNSRPAMCRPSGLCRDVVTATPGVAPGLFCGGPFGASEIKRNNKTGISGCSAQSVTRYGTVPVVTAVAGGRFLLSVARS